MRVVHVATSLASRYGGPARSVGLLASAQADLGCHVTLFAPRDADSQDLVIPNSPSLTTQIVPRKELYQTVLSVCRQCDVVHSHGIWSHSNRLTASAARITGKPHVISPRGMLFPEALAHKRWKKRLGWWLFQRRDFLGASLIHAASDAELHAIRRAGWNGRVVVAPNGVMIPKVSSQKNPNQHRRAMFLGRLHRQKGLEDLLAAWGAVRPTGWELIVVGPDEDGTLARCQQQAREHHIESDITWHGPARSDQTADLLASAELFVLPSHFESFGLAIAEALAVGTPVICNRASPWQQVTTQGCGWWIECGVGPLAESLKVATSLPPDELRRMGERGRAWMERDFSWASVARTIVDAYALI